MADFDRGRTQANEPVAFVKRACTISVACTRSVDDQSEGASVDQHVEVRRDPFGAFKVNRASLIITNDQDPYPDSEER